ncbi:hypothetical protein BGZ83_008086 [Gryganskiella cystojenkinii]|nr:hypothetical protein BGZ83_008086 [Gryganskiella cystojenkinii]
MFPGTTVQGQNMMKYDPATGNSQVLPMPAQIAKHSYWGYGVVWSTYRNSILMYGGLRAYGENISNANLWEFVPTTST